MRFAFRLCRDLNIDDPVAWFNSCPQSVFDWWIAYYLITESGDKSGEQMTPDEALKKLNSRMR